MPGFADPCTLSALVVPEVPGECATQTKMSELPAVATFAPTTSSCCIAVRNGIICATVASFPFVQAFFFSDISNYLYSTLWTVKYMQRISSDVINIFIIYSMFILRIYQLFTGEFIILFILLFLLRRKASQISKMQKRIRLLCPNWTRKTLNNVTHLFPVIPNDTQKNGHKRPRHRARSHFCRRRCSPHLWRLLHTFASFR